VDKKKVVTIVDVAREARVSTSTVSRVINEAPTVKATNRLRVEEAIRRLNYRPDPSAQRLAAGGRSGTIGLLVPHFEGIFYSFYASELLKGAGAGATESGLDILIHIIRGTPEEAAFFRTHIFNPKYLAGILIADLDPKREQIKEIEQQKIPFLLMNYFVEEGDISCVAVDNIAASMSVADYLIGLGHRNVATITGDLNIQCAQQRLEGFRRGLEARGVVLEQGFVAEGGFVRPKARRCAEHLLAQEPHPTAIFVASDEMALEAIGAIKAKGLEVPGDISIVGFDDNPIATLGGHAQLTTVWQPLAEMGRISANILSQIIQGEQKSPVKRLLATRLVERDSCQPPKGG